MEISASHSAPPQWVLQFCHGYEGPFLDCARQYATLFRDTPYRVCTVYLTGRANEEVRKGSASDEVIFLEFSSKDVRGLKLGAIRRLREIVKGREFKFCIAHRFKPIYISLLATSLPVIGVQHAFGVYRRPVRSWLINHFRSRVLLLGVSNAVSDEMRTHLPQLATTHIRTLYNRLDVTAVQAEQLTRKEARKQLQLPEHAWVVGNVGRLHPDKDQTTLIRGFAVALPDLPPDSVLVIIGAGRLESRLKELVDLLGLNDKVLFLGQVKAARRYFKAFDVFVLSSNHEPFGMVLLEAMAAGIPIVSSELGGAQEVVEGAGHLFPQGDVQALADRLHAVSRMTEMERGQTRQAMFDRLITRYSDEAVRPQFFRVLQEEGYGGLETTGA